MLAKSKWLASMIPLFLGVVVALEGELFCDLKHENCQLITDKRTHSELHYQLVDLKSGAPYFAPGFNSTYVRVQGELNGETLSVVSLRHALARQPFEGSGK